MASAHGRPQARIIVVEENRAAPRTNHYICRDQVDFCFEPGVLPAFFFRRPSDLILDLMRVVASVAHADRRIPRRPSACWGRDFELVIPVSNPDFWGGEPSAALARLLHLLSGDVWSFSFRKLADQPQLPLQTELEFPCSGELAMAYSNGLDSFASARLVASGTVNLSDGPQKKRDIVLVTTGRKLNAELKNTMTQFGYSVRQVSVPFQIRRNGAGFQLRETSYRTRAFVFQTMAALAAFQSEGNTVIVAESGQGSLGPWLTVTGQEAADVRTHPLFTRALADFLKPILDRQIRFEHPHLWETKGETLRRLVESNLHSGWCSTFSCATQVRHQESEGKHLHCGVCPNCLLRRQSLLAAGLEDGDDQYDCQRALAGDENIDERERGKLRKRVAQGLFPLLELANLRATPLLARTAQRKLANFARDVGATPDLIVRHTNTLVDTHRRELVNFIASCPKDSLVRELGEALS
jgi:7-cyano-7-deazaguanine synthase in queuosine biosynthesis